MNSEMLIDEPGFAVSGRARQRGPGEDRVPLIIAIHGGGFTGDYFDLPGYSLIARAVERGYGVVAIDRLGHGRSREEGRDEQTLVSNKEWLSKAIGGLWNRYGAGCHGVVLIGHSIGGALAVMVAAERQDWPLAGVAVSGVGLADNPALRGFFDTLPPDPWMGMPGEAKDGLMLAEPRTYDPAVVGLLHQAYIPVATRELIEVYSNWVADAPELLRALKVPIQLRLGEFDALWTVDADTVQRIRDLTSAVEGSSAALVEEAGHAIDFHHVGRDFHDRQLDFALESVRSDTHR